MTSRASVRILLKGHQSWQDRFIPMFRDLAVLARDTIPIYEDPTWYPDDTLDTESNRIHISMLNANTK